jgi:hypothetical protein
MNRSILCITLLAPFGCFKAPQIVVVDRATALEQQAGGSFAAVDAQLAKGAVGPRPEAFTPNQLETAGIKPAALVDHTEHTQADRVDDLLQQHCIGEGKDGLLVDTHDDCVGAADRTESITLVNRVNHARVQLFRWMHHQRPDVAMDALRRAWHDAHARGVVCGGWIQRDDDHWEAKKC